jgi:hypothetical protein
MIIGTVMRQTTLSLVASEMICGDSIDSTVIEVGRTLVSYFRWNRVYRHWHNCVNRLNLFLVAVEPTSSSGMID